MKHINGGSDTNVPVRRKILITDTTRWPVGPRLAIAFSNMECEVAVLCPSRGHPVEKISAVHQILRHSGLNPLKALRSAIESFAPDFIVPLCDRGVQHLHDLYNQADPSTSSGGKIRQLIERSLGSPESFRTVSSRHDLLQLARSEGILVPGMAAIGCNGELNSWDEHTAPPWVIKADGTWGGRGVRVAKTSKESKQHFHELAEHPGLIEQLKRLLLNRDRAWILSERKQALPGIIAQSFIDGRPANCAAVCWEGELLACICVEVIQAQGPKEPATVVQLVGGEEMRRAAKRIAKRLKLSGFFGLDFVIESGTGLTYLIEMNPRCTPPCPLPLGRGRDLVAALCAQLTGEPRRDRKCVTEKETIAYFPQCREGDGTITSAGIAADAFYDVPEGEPELVQNLLHPWSARSYLGQLLDWVREKTDRENTLTRCMFKDAITCVKTEGRVDVVSSELSN